MTKLFTTLMAALVVTGMALGQASPLQRDPDVPGRWIRQVDHRTTVKLGQPYGLEELKLFDKQPSKPRSPRNAYINVAVYNAENQLVTEQSMHVAASASGSAWSADVAANYRKTLRLDKKTFILRVSVVWEFEVETCEPDLTKGGKRRLTELVLPCPYVVIAIERRACLDLVYTVECDNEEKCKEVSASVAANIGSVGNMSYTQQIKHFARNANVKIAIKGEQWGFDMGEHGGILSKGKEQPEKPTIVNVLAAINAKEPPAADLLKLVTDAANNVSPEHSPIVLVKLSPITYWVGGKTKKEEVAAQEAKWDMMRLKAEAEVLHTQLADLASRLNGSPDVTKAVCKERDRVVDYIKKIKTEMSESYPDLKKVGELPKLQLPAESLVKDYGWVKRSVVGKNRGLENGTLTSMYGVSPLVEFFGEQWIKSVTISWGNGGEVVLDEAERKGWNQFTQAYRGGGYRSEAEKITLLQKFEKVKFAVYSETCGHSSNTTSTLTKDFDKKIDGKFTLNIETIWGERATIDVGNPSTKPYDEK